MQIKDRIVFLMLFVYDVFNPGWCTQLPLKGFDDLLLTHGLCCFLICEEYCFSMNFPLSLVRHWLFPQEDTSKVRKMINRIMGTPIEIPGLKIGCIVVVV